ncbi:zinc finger CCHC domain-containing protein 4 [Ceratina calcarata]|uniref:Zinc finger CCHC domain-containing protein 4 n=1 Tax=Ceratina calcarata TaxID=156304 RepID=A0AAJ7IWD0_9HYME|nr:zinc finger CCHC domain-containing protein 4 [Ceratina calcarata]
MECFWSDLSKHPRCPHGPTILFGTSAKGKLEKFYACSACRERKMCRFYLKAGQNLTKNQISQWERETKQYVSRYHHRPLYLRLNVAMGLAQDKRFYCHTCEQLVLKNEKDNLTKHSGHDLKEGLTDYEMKHPTEILKPLENSKQEAQYFFTKQSTEDIVNILLKLNAKQALCIGTPKIHEYILENHEDKISSLLLDFDARFHNFFGPLNYCWYNLMNNHFFDENAIHVFKDFLTQNRGKDTYLICDPPFGARVEAMSWTLKRISDLHKKWNNIEDESDCLKILFIFPYFMESIMRQKSNPPGISGGLKDLRMTDYKVSYENHTLFVTDSNSAKLSPIRIFTNVPLNLFELPEASGYKYCRNCEKWVARENRHCKKCKECTSKNGLTYKHCNICKRCVKPYWKHCSICNRCAITKHSCGQKPKVSGNCHKCNKPGHTEKECEINAIKVEKANKRKATNEILTNNIKKKKVDNTLTSDDNELEHTKKESGINTTEGKKATKRKATEKKLTNNVKQEVDSTRKSNDNEPEHTGEKSGTNTTKAKKSNKRKATEEKKLAKNVKKEMDSTRESDDREPKTSMKNKLEKNSEINVKLLKNTKSSRTKHKAELHSTSNGIAKTKE